MCPLQHAVVVFNQASGPASAERRAILEEAFTAAGLDACIVPAAGREIVRAAERAASRAGALVAAGGDGTVSAVASVALKAGVTFGVVPMGTLNHFARDVGIPADPRSAAAVVAAGRTRLLDVGDVNGSTFLNNASLGIYPRLVAEREAEQRRGRRKSIAFAIAIARTWRDYRPITVRITFEGVPPLVRRTPFVFVGNGEYQSEGLDLGRRSSVGGGRLWVSVAPELGRFEALALPFRAVAGRLPTYDKFESFSSSGLSVEGRRREVSVALDGELVWATPPFRFAVRSGALRTLVPEA